MPETGNVLLDTSVAVAHLRDGIIRMFEAVIRDVVLPLTGRLLAV